MYSREIDGQVLTLAASGWTYYGVFVLYDKETESLWYPFSEDPGLTCVQGVYQNSFLPARESLRTSWDRWYGLHPDTKYLLCKDAVGHCDQPD